MILERKLEEAGCAQRQLFAKGWEQLRQWAAVVVSEFCGEALRSAHAASQVRGDKGVSSSSRSEKGLEGLELFWSSSLG